MMANAWTIARWIVVSIALGAVLVVVGCGGDDSEHDETGTSFFPNTPARPAGLEVAVYDADDFSIEYPVSWTLTEEFGEARFESPAGSVVSVRSDRSVEVPEAAEEDAVAVQYIVDQVIGFVLPTDPGTDYP
jgi:hypothetical protein